MAFPKEVTNPLTNKGTAFSQEERQELGIVGRLPSRIESLETQARRCYQQIQKFENDLAKYHYLDLLHDRNEVLYFKVLVDHLSELLPIVYDPTIGEAIENWSDDYRYSRALYLSIDAPEDIETAFKSLNLDSDAIDLIVCSDAEQILGIGDWGVNGTDISIGKLAIYTAAAGIDPARVIAVNLDVGTDNEKLLNDPLYLGNQHARVRGDRYDAFIKKYLETASKLFPQAILHFEDFGPSNARRILEQYRDDFRIFNDDMQGTGAIVMAAVISGLKVAKSNFANQRLVVFGAGTAGTGMADQISAAMVRDGLSEDDAKKQVWLIDKNGLVTDDQEDLPNYQKTYARSADEVKDWNRKDGVIDLLEVVKQVKPTILIGTSTVHHGFTEEIVKAMAKGVERPIILPLSNPTSRIEAFPEDLIEWTDGKALIATGIPVKPAEYNGTTYHIGQGNNALLYPGLGLGVVVARAKKVTDSMLQAAAEAVSNQVDPTIPGASILPDVETLRASSATVAVDVVKAAISDGVAENKPENIVQAVQDAMWVPAYSEQSTQKS